MGKKILVVEDYEDSRGFLSFLLKNEGYEVKEAGDGLEAVESIKRDCPDLILMDIAMPHMDGLTATRIIRTSYCAEDVPIIALTAFGHSFYDEAIEAGCNDLIDKPIKFEELEPVINQYLKP